MFRDFQSWFNEKLALRRNRRKASVRKTTLAFDNLEERAVMDGAYWNLATQGAFQQDWSNTSQISSDNDWSGVPSITGQSGAGLDKGILSIAQVDDIVTVTTAIGNTNLNSSAAANRFVVGQQVTILGTTNYNGNYTILRAIDQNHFQFKTNVTGLPAEFTGTASSTSLSAQAATAVDGKASFVVRANQTNPSSNTNFGVAEFDSLPNPTIALAGDAANPTPFIQINLNTVNSNNIRVQYTLRDLGGSGASQPIALQYRQDGAGSFGSYSNTGTWRPVDWTNVPGAYIVNATNGGSTNVDVILPTTAEGKTFFQLRIITANSTGADQWIGVDDIKVSAVGRINLTNASGSEGDGTVTVTATRTNGSSGAVSATYTTPYAIASATSSGSTATITTSGSHSFAVGQVVTVAGVSVAGYNTNATILSVTPNSFTYTTSTQNLAAGTGGTVTSGSGASSGTATITTSTPSQTDYSASSGVISFADGQTSQTFTVSVIDNGNNVFGVSAASNSGTTATITTTANHTFVVGQTVTISGVADAAYNGTYVLTAVTGNTITYTVPVAPSGASTGGTVSGAEPAQETVPLALISNSIPIASITTNPNTLITTVTTSSPHGFSVGQQVVASQTGIVNADTGALIFSGVSSGNTATITTAANHPFIVGQTVTIEGASDAGYNGTVVITAVPATNQFSYTTVGSNLPAATTGGTIVSGSSRAISSITSVAGASFNISAATFAAGVATITTAANHSFVAGQFVVIAGVGAGQYNGTYQILGTPAANQFTYAPYNIPTGNSSGGTASFNTVTLTTSAPHSFGVNSQINVTGSSQAAYNGSFPIVSVTANTISYVIGGASAPAAAGATGYITSNASVDMYTDMPVGIGGFIITSVTPTSFTFKAQNNRSNNSAIASSAVGGTVRLATAALIGTASSTLNINDNDGAGTVEFTSADYTVGEAKGTAIITLKRTGDTTGGLVVSYATSEDPFAFNAAFAGVDFTQTSGVVAFAPGQTTASFTVPITNDAGLEGPEVFNVALSNLVGGPGASLGAQSTAVVTIIEPGSIAINPSTVTVSEGDGFATVTVVRTGSTTGTATVFYSTSNGSATAGSDYTATTGRLFWGDGDNSSQTFQIPITDDSVTAEALSESINASIANSWNVSTATQSGTTATITTSAAHGFQVGDSVVIRNVSVAGYNGVFTITGTSATTFTYETVSGLLAGSGGTAAYDDASIGTANGTVNIIDNDGTGTIQFSSPAYSVGEGKGSVTLTVNRVGSSTGPLNVAYTTLDGTAEAGSDYNLTTGVISWNDGENAPKTISINITNDNTIVEGSQSFTVQLTGVNQFNNAFFGAPAVVLGSAATVTITEPGQIQFSAPTYQASEGVATVTVNVNRVNGSTGPATVQYTSAFGSAKGSNNISQAYSVGTTATIVTPTAHNFASGETVNVTGASDAGYNGTFVISSASAATPIASVSATPTTVTVATGNNPYLVVGQSVTVAGVSDGRYNGNVTVTAVTPTSFSYIANAGAPIATASSSGTTATITTSSAHRFSAGQTVTIAGLSDAGYNGTFTIVSAPTGTTFTITTAAADLPAATGGTATIPSVGAGGTVTNPLAFQYTTAGSDLPSGAGGVAYQDYISPTGSIFWADGDASNKSIVIPITDDALIESPESFTVSLTNGVAITTATQSGTTATITTATAHGFSVGNQVTINGSSVGGYNGTFTITTVSANSFTFETTAGLAAATGGLATTVAGPVLGSPTSATVNIGDNDGTGVVSLSSATYTLPENYGPVAVGIVSASSSGNTATITAPNHPFSVGQLVNIAGMNNGNYNGLFAITATTANTFSYTTTGANLTVGMGAIATLAATITSATAAGNVVTITTSAPHGFLADHQVAVNNLDAGYTGTFTITSATANTFTYVSTGSPAASSAIQATSNAIISAPLAVTVNRTGGSAGTVSVVYNVSGGTAVAGKDYAGVYTNNNNASLLNNTLTFGPGETSKTFFIRPVDNNISDGNRTVNIALSNVLGGGSLGATSSAVLTITDFEPGRPVFVSSTFNASGGSVTITVNRIGGSSGVLSANYSTISDTAVAGVDFTAVTGTLTWADGDIAPKTFNVPLLTTFTPGDGKTFKVSLGQTGLGSSAAANPAVWYDFNNDANPLDGQIVDNSSTGIPLVHRQRNGNSPTSTFVGMPEQYNSPGGVVSYYLSSGASFPGAGDAFFMEGGLSRTYDTFEPVTGTVVNTTVGGSNSSRNELDVAAQAWIAAGNDSRTYRSALLNSGDNNTGQSAITYTLWMQLPELVGADFNGNKYPNGPNQRSLIGRSSDPGTGDGGIAGQSDFGGNVYINTIPNYKLEPDYDPLNLTGTVKYGFQFRGNTPSGGGSGNSTTTSTTNFKVGEWNQFAFVITPTKIDVYKNGALSESLNVQMFDALKGSIEDIKGFLSLNFGSIGGAAREQGNVNIDDFGVWTSALGASDIQAIYQKGIREAVANTAQVGSDFTPPVITNVSPASGPTAGGTVVTITGNFFTGATSVKFGTTAATSFTVNSGTSITATAPAGTLGTVDIFITTPLGTSTVTPSGKFTYIAAPTVSSVVLNANNPGLAGAQRSMVNSVVYTFNQAVNLAPGAVSISLRPGITINGVAAANPGIVPTVNLSTPDGGLTWIATFSGAGVIGGSIANGVYDLKLNAASVTAVSGGLALAANKSDVFYRLFGDIDGNSRVNAVDYNGFLSTFGLRSNQVGYILAYDVDNSGRVNATDYNGFLFNFGKRFGGFTPTI